MSLNAENLIVGVPVIYIGTSLAALPEMDDATDELSFGSGWTECTGTDDGVELSYKAEYDMKYVDAHLAAVAAAPIKEEAKVSFSIAESDLGAFNRAISLSSLSEVASGSNQVGQDVLKVGDGAYEEVQLALYGQSPEGFWRVFYAPRAMKTTDLKKQFKKGFTSMQVSFDLLADPTATAGETLFTITDMTELQSS